MKLNSLLIIAAIVFLSGCGTQIPDFNTDESLSEATLGQFDRILDKANPVREKLVIPLIYSNEKSLEVSTYAKGQPLDEQHTCYSVTKSRSALSAFAFLSHQDSEYLKDGKLLNHSSICSLAGPLYIGGKHINNVGHKNTEFDLNLYGLGFLYTKMFYSETTNKNPNISPARELNHEKATANAVGFGFLYFDTDIRTVNESLDTNHTETHNKKIRAIGYGSIYYGNSDKHEKSHNYLFGILGHGKDKKGSYFKFLWIPIHY